MKMDFSCQLCIVVATILMFGSLNFASVWSPPNISDYEDHPCRRDCLGASSMTCEYNFTIEHYQTLSRACYECPYNTMDCHRPHCVPADGFLRAIKVVNRMMPGPALHVCKDDRLVVNVYNQLNDFEGTSIHWHGILQEGTPHMDGVAMVTQCPIPVHSVFQYRFRVQNAGTHYWHAHAGLQRGDGIFGALVVRDTSVTSVKRHYDDDLPEHTVFLQDWLDQYSSSKFSLHHHGMSDNEPSSILINGKGATFSHERQAGGTHDGHDTGSTDPMDIANGNDHNSTMTGMGNTTISATTAHTHDEDLVAAGTTMPPMPNMADETTNTEKAFVPHTVFNVRHGRRYRFRIISNGILNCPLKVSVENHQLTIIASDGNDLQPTEVESITVFAGERYDVVLVANQNVGNYWMHVLGLGDCEPSHVSQTAIVRYDTAMEMLPATGHEYSDGDRVGRNGNSMTFTKDTVTVADMTSVAAPRDVYTSHNVRKFYINLGYNEVENHHFLDPVYYSLPTMYELHQGTHADHLFALQINDITFRMPMSPVLTQYADLDEDSFCNETSTPTNCRNELCECVHRIKIDLGAVVEFVLISTGMYGLGNHPMHLHGHNFYVLGMEKVNTTVSRSMIEELDLRGRLKRNLRNPIKKDTVMVPDGGYTIIRFRAANPGIWLFHCHVDFHMALGMAAVIQVGEIHEMRATPVNFPRCGSWRYSEGSAQYDMCKNYTSSANKHATNITFLLLLVGLSILDKIHSQFQQYQHK